MAVDYSLYLVTERRILGDTSLKEAVEKAIIGGVTIVQVREKDVSTREFYQVALEVKKVTDYYRVPLLINDRIDIAQAIDADGVHLGQKDMPLTVARNILGRNKIIGISAGSVIEAREAEEKGADYIGVSGVFPTNSKKDVKITIGLEGLQEISAHIKIPKVAIGGINVTNTKDVIRSGADGIAVISAILGEKDIRGAAGKLKTIINKF